MTNLPSEKSQALARLHSLAAAQAQHTMSAAPESRETLAKVGPQLQGTFRQLNDIQVASLQQSVQAQREHYLRVHGVKEGPSKPGERGYNKKTPLRHQKIAANDPEV